MRFENYFILEINLFLLCPYYGLAIISNQSQPHKMTKIHSLGMLTHRTKEAQDGSEANTGLKYIGK